MKIRNARDLAQWLGTQDDSRETLSRLLYKATDCGAWLDLRDIEVTVRPAKTVYQVILRDSICGPVAICWRPGRRGEWRYFQPHGEGAPRRLVAYLHPVPSKDVWTGPTSSLLEVSSEAGATVADVKARAPFGRWGTSRTMAGYLHEIPLEWTESVMKPGVAVGSIVEGSDAECETHELAFPFDSADFNRAVEEIEAEADVLWHEANEAGDDDRDNQEETHS